MCVCFERKLITRNIILRKRKSKNFAYFLLSVNKKILNDKKKQIVVNVFGALFTLVVVFSFSMGLNCFIKELGF